MIKTQSCALIVCCFLCVGQQLNAQGAKFKLMPHHDPSTAQGMEGGMWRTDANFESILQLKNVLVNHPLTATPILYMADGTEYQLPTITLDPAGVASVNINTAVSEMPAALAAHRSLYGMLGVKYNWSWPAMMGLVRNIDEGEMVSFYSSLHSDVNEVHSSSAQQKSQEIEGLWWKPYENTSGFLLLSNTLLKPIQAMVAAYDSSGNALGHRTMALGSHQSMWLALSDLLGSQQPTGAMGGLKISYQGPEYGLSAVGGLENDTNGYSATFTLQEMHPENARNLSVHQVVLDAPGIMIGEQTPAMQFPQNTYFLPYGYLHNTSAQSRQVSVSATLAGPKGPQTYSVATLALGPNATQQIDYKDILKTLNLSPTTSIDISVAYTGNDGDVLVEEGSVDQSGNYVFEVEPQAEGWTISRTICHWELHDETNTMISLWNYSSTAEDLKLTLYFTGGQYVLPVHLEPRADYEVDVATLVHSAQPDANGTIIPQSITEGSAILADAQDQGNHIFVASSTGVFNVRTGTCSPTCQYCNGVSEIAVIPGPINVAINETSQAQAQLTYNTGEVTGGSPYSWTASNTAITTVNYTSGLVTGVGAGSDDIDCDFIDLPSPAGYICLVGNCPTFGGSGSGPANVAPVITSIDPSQVTPGAQSVQVTLNGSGFGTSPTVNLPSGVTQTGITSTNTRIVVTVNVSVNAPNGPSNVSVTASGQTSNTVSLIVNGPSRMVVQSDIIGTTTDNPSEQSRFVTYQVQNYDQTAAASIPIAEAITESGWSCTQANPGDRTAACNAEYHTESNGIFEDEWGMYTGYTPAGCGINITDHWQWCAPAGTNPPAPNPGHTFGTLTGFVHTANSEINGYENPPTPMPAGTVILP